MFDRMNYEGQIFGNRIIISNTCSDNDWSSIGKSIPKEKEKYRLSQCMECGSRIPVLIDNIKRQPPKKCSFCSNINHHSMIKSQTNNWVNTDQGYAVGNIIYKNQVITCIIDSDDLNRVKNRIWRVSKKKNKYYLVSGSKNRGDIVYLHKFILNKEIPSGYEIDHIDGNSLNNRKNNLRIVTRLENIQNVSERIDNQIGIRGIAKTPSGKYKVDFSFNNKRYYFKDWDTLSEAVYCRKYAEEYFGLNMINRNPITKDYLNISEQDKQSINRYVLANISKETV